MTILEARMMTSVRLRFDAAIPSKTSPQAYGGLNSFGPYDVSSVDMSNQSILFVFPEDLRDLARRLAMALRDGYKNFRGLSQMFRVPFHNEQVEHLAVDGDCSTLSAAAKAYREKIASWNASPHTDPKLAVVVVPHSERWQTDRPYYEAKAAFARLGIPTQMVTSELISNEREFGWSVANIALGIFAKLGGIPWVVDSPADDNDLIVGVGRAEIRRTDGIRRIFGYAMCFTSNGVYRQNWSFTPAADEETYVAKLTEAVSTPAVDRDLGRGGAGRGTATG